jgi:hypothetical protein
MMATLPGDLIPNRYGKQKRIIRILSHLKLNIKIRHAARGRGPASDLSSRAKQQAADVNDFVAGLRAVSPIARNCSSDGVVE